MEDYNVMEDYTLMIQSAFAMGSVRDAEALFEQCIANAFPTFHFRRLELIRFIRGEEYMEGRSWNHVFAREIWMARRYGRSPATVSPWGKHLTNTCTWITPASLL